MTATVIGIVIGIAVTEDVTGGVTGKESVTETVIGTGTGIGTVTEKGSVTADPRVSDRKKSRTEITRTRAERPTT